MTMTMTIIIIIMIIIFFFFFTNKLQAKFYKYNNNYYFNTCKFKR